ncbi:hypothetical protein EDD21DRAFT_367434, partial [Dissophora ornata]
MEMCGVAWTSTVKLFVTLLSTHYTSLLGETARLVYCTHNSFILWHCNALANQMYTTLFSLLLYGVHTIFSPVFFLWRDTTTVHWQATIHRC